MFLGDHKNRFQTTDSYTGTMSSTLLTNKFHWVQVVYFIKPRYRCSFSLKTLVFFVWQFMLSLDIAEWSSFLKLHIIRSRLSNMGEDSRNLRRWNIPIYCVMEILMSHNIIPNMLSQICFSLLGFFKPMPVYAQLGISDTPSTLTEKQVGILSPKTIPKQERMK